MRLFVNPGAPPVELGIFGKIDRLPCDRFLYPFVGAITTGCIDKREENIRRLFAKVGKPFLKSLEFAVIVVLENDGYVFVGNKIDRSRLPLGSNTQDVINANLSLGAKAGHDRIQISRRLIDVLNM